MADRRSKKQDRQSRRDAAQRAGRFIGLSAAASTFLTFSLSPLVHMPVAKADGEDIIIDQIINSLSAVDPTVALDMSSWLSSLDAALQGAANFDPSSLDAALGGASALDPSSLDAAGTAGLDPASAAADPAASSSLAGLYDQFIYDRRTPGTKTGLTARPSWATSLFSTTAFINQFAPAGRDVHRQRC